MFPVSTFRNTWGYSWENKDYGMRLTGEMMDELFGVDETNINVFGWLIRKPEAGLFGEITNKHIPGGICFGMAFGVAQTFDSPNWVNEFPRTGNTASGASIEPNSALRRAAALGHPALLAAVHRRADSRRARPVHRPADQRARPDHRHQRNQIPGRAGEAAADARPDALVRRLRSALGARLRLGAGPERHDDRLRLQPEHALHRPTRRATGASTSNARVHRSRRSSSATPTATGSSTSSAGRAPTTT